jgi:hypothetical protein
MSYEGLGKHWINGPGFVKWLEEIRPAEMRRGDSFEGGRSTWASEAQVRAIYAAEKEGRTLTLAVADDICVTLNIHIDSEMPAGLWTECPRRGNPPTEKAVKAKAALEAGASISEATKQSGLSRKQVRRIMYQLPAYQGLEPAPNGNYGVKVAA